MLNILLFGGSGGIGQSLVNLSKQSYLEDYNFICISRDPQKGIPCDYSVESIDSVFEDTSKQYGPIWGVVNLVGSVLIKPAHLTSTLEFDAVMQTNVYTSFNILRSAVKNFNNQPGTIVLCSSSAATIGLSNHEAIACAKGALISLAKSASATYASKKIRVNCVAPGLTKTPLTKRITSTEAGVKASLSMHPLGRLGEPEDIAKAIYFLLDPKNDWITGQTISVDGGLGSLKINPS